MEKFSTLELAIKQFQNIEELKLKNEKKDQIERAALSVCLNLSEGSAKLTRKDRRRFLNIAYASQREIKTLLLITKNPTLFESADILAAMIFRLQQNTKDSAHRST